MVAGFVTGGSNFGHRDHNRFSGAGQHEADESGRTVAGSGSSVLQVLVLAASMHRANDTCYSIVDACQCSCTHWAGLRAHSSDEPTVRALFGLPRIHANGSARASAVQSQQMTPHRLADLAHASAWQWIADWGGDAPTLVIDEGQRVRPDRSRLVTSLLSNASAFVPAFDLFFLDASPPFGQHEVGTPAHSLRVPQHGTQVSQLAKSIRSRAYAVSTAGAKRLLALLRADRLQVVAFSVEEWLATKIVTSGNAAPAGSRAGGLRAFMWDREADLVEGRRGPTGMRSNVLSTLWRTLFGARAS